MNFPLIDLHQDRSDNALCTTHKDFFASGNVYYGRNCENNINPCNQVDLVRLIKGNVKASIGAIFIDPDAMDNIDAARFELNRHLKYYNRVVKESGGVIYEILSSDDLLNIKNSHQVGLLKHIEGFYFVKNEDKDFSILDDVYSKGVRSIALSWGTDSNLCGGNTLNNMGLTDLGKEFLEKLLTKDIIIDLAHCSQQSFKDVMKIINKPVMVSHTKITDKSNKARFLTENQAKRLANGGGIMGIFAMKNEEDRLPIVDMESYVSHIKKTINVVGEDHVAIGTDFDGLSQEHIIEGFEDVSCTNNLYNEMIRQGIPNTQIEKIFYQNALHFIQSSI